MRILGQVNTETTPTLQQAIVGRLVVRSVGTTSCAPSGNVLGTIQPGINHTRRFYVTYLTYPESDIKLVLRVMEAFDRYSP